MTLSKLHTLFIYILQMRKMRYYQSIYFIECES